jgi:poly(3-hydroxybutyrate) depolymerase
MNNSKQSAAATSAGTDKKQQVKKKPLKQGRGSFYINKAWAGPRVDIEYYVPKQTRADMPVLFVLHGVRRNAADYCDMWRKAAEQHAALILAPCFSAEHFPRALNYNLGAVYKTERGGVRKQPEAASAFAAIEVIFANVRLRQALTTNTYSMFGHSAGAQFVHRYVFFAPPEARLHKAVAANAGWYTMPCLSTPFPYGFKNTDYTRTELARALAAPLVIALGAKDTDVKHKHLRRTTEANAQGAHRFARGQAFFAAGQAEAKKLAAAAAAAASSSENSAAAPAAAISTSSSTSLFGWTVLTVPGVPHSGARMSRWAAKHVFFPSKEAKKVVDSDDDEDDDDDDDEPEDDDDDDDAAEEEAETKAQVNSKSVSSDGE